MPGHTGGWRTEHTGSGRAGGKYPLCSTFLPWLHSPVSLPPLLNPQSCFPCAFLLSPRLSLPTAVVPSMHCSALGLSCTSCTWVMLSQCWAQFQWRSWYLPALSQTALRGAYSKAVSLKGPSVVTGFLGSLILLVQPFCLVIALASYLSACRCSRALRVPKAFPSNSHAPRKSPHSA